MNTEKCVAICNDLLRGEISAMETYDQALEAVSGQSESFALKSIRKDHRDSADSLRDRIIKMGAQPTEDSGAWGEFAKATEGGAKMLGETAALAVLQAGEKHGELKYSRAANNEDMAPDCRELIVRELIPRQRQHVNALESLRA